MNTVLLILPVQSVRRDNGPKEPHRDIPVTVSITDTGSLSFGFKEKETSPRPDTLLYSSPTRQDLQAVR